MRGIHTLIDQLTSILEVVPMFNGEEGQDWAGLLHELLNERPVKVVVSTVRYWRWCYVNKELGDCIGIEAGMIELDKEAQMRRCFDPISTMYFHTAYQHYAQGGQGVLGADVAVKSLSGRHLTLRSTSVLLRKACTEKEGYFAHIMWEEKDELLINALGLPGVAELTPRQRETLKMLVGGECNEEISHQMGISLKTLEKHILAVLRAAQCQNQAALLELCRAHI